MSIMLDEDAAARPPTDDRGPAAPSTPSRGGLVWRRLRRNRLAVLGAVIIVLLFVAAFTYGFATMIVGGPFTERIFGWYGMGDWLVTGIQTEDTNLTATVTLFVAVCVLVSGFLADLAYAALDPRIRI